MLGQRGPDNVPKVLRRSVFGGVGRSSCRFHRIHDVGTLIDRKPYYYDEVGERRFNHVT